MEASCYLFISSVVILSTMNRNEFILFSVVFLAGAPSIGLAQNHLNDLHKALKSQDKVLVQALLQSLSPEDPETQATLSSADEDGRSPLILAIREGLGFPIIRRLLSLGADVNPADREGKTALIYAAAKGHMGLMQELLNKGAKVDHVDRFGWTALGQAVVATSNEQDQFKVLQLFLKSGASLNGSFPSDSQAYSNTSIHNQLQGRTILTWAIESKSVRLTSLILRSLMKQPAWVNQRDGRGRTPLIQAVESGQFQLVEDFVSDGADATLQDDLGWTALSKLLAQGRNPKASQQNSGQEQMKWMKIFLDQSKKTDQIFPATEAAYLNKKEFHKFQGRSILAWAVESDRADVIALLLEQGADLGPLEPLLMASIERGNLEMLALAVGQGVNLCPKQSSYLSGHFSGHTPLTLAAEKGRFEVVKFILNALSHAEGALIPLNECDLNGIGKEGRTALGWAGAKANLEVAQLIIQKGEDQFFGVSELRTMLAAAGTPQLKGKWIEYFSVIQLSTRLTDLLNIKSESVIAFEGERLENQNPEFRLSVEALKSLMNQKAKELYYQEQEREIHERSQGAMEIEITSCMVCLETIMVGDQPPLGPAGCSCNIICSNSECTEYFCNTVVNRNGEDVSRCPGCKNPVYSKYLVEHGVSEEDAKKVRNRCVDILNSQQLGWRFCPTTGCAGGRVVQPQEKSAYYSCILCAHEGCIKCGNEHKGDCGNYEKEMKEFENLLRLGAMAPLKNRPADPNHPDYMKGRFRPCYHCGVITERDGGCSHITCKRCRAEWEWNWGPYERGKFTMEDQLPMKFKPLTAPHW